MVIGLTPGSVLCWMNKLTNGTSTSHKILERCLHSIMSEDEAIETLDVAIKEGVLVYTPNAKSAPASVKRGLLSFTQKLSKQRAKTDPYCFECHLPTSGLVQKCIMCVRSFHVECQRKNPLRPNYSVPSDRCQQYRFPLNESDMEESSDQEASRSVSDTLEAQRLQELASCELDCNSNINIISQNPLKDESDSSDDVCFVSEQLPRKTKNYGTYVKSEETPHNEDNNELLLCTPCRLLKLAEFLNPPHMSNEELNYLLNYSWQMHHTWVENDVRKYMVNNWSDRDATLVKNILFVNDLLSISDISRSIETKKFKHLSEFLVDLLDLQHNIGIFFGTKCEEYNATKWLLRDITHDLREISRCSDCFRHSIESNRSDFWFAKPCTQRHELVYAKQSGYPHWPAKVIRVMSKKNNTYDVRFFGGSHSRALVPARDILPIDTDTSKLKIKSSRQYNNAMRELMCHQMLLHHPIYSFSFHADPREAENIINSALPHYMEPCSRSAKRARLATPKLNTRRSTAETTPNLPQRVLPRRRCRIAQGPENLQDSTFQMASSVIPSLAPELQVSLLPEVQVSLAPEVQVSLAPEVQVSIEDYNELMREVLHLNAQLSQKKAEVDIKREELKAVKRKRWCQLCLEEAQFDCCFMASYCSVVCQRRDKRRHQTNCNLQEKT
ncbi:zinc finger MYND domain-containing protein 11 isoform X1 [Drosophila sulfurigaster albostrigata]|uniref:zinc finger MYND domain-containing protein 11 isoform X1 n=1 Tax=Drosophila sulfurigaster albostrigata TaxID=89887 RepID=UPI002D21A320|nr:zinc finger MYND domain-containing protein 11 isoform X1 [Drosophila sulfurigaster albostrigata]